MVEIVTAEGHQLNHKEMAEMYAKRTGLSKREAEVFILRRIKDLDVETVADHLSVSTGAISSYSKRYREKIEEAESLLKFVELYN